MTWERLEPHDVTGLAIVRTRPPVVITIIGKRRDWRFLWLRTRPVEKVLYRGQVEPWPPPSDPIV